MSSPSATQATRRRQRSTRLTVAVGLLVLAALVVIGAVLSGSTLLIVLAAFAALVLGAAATKITHAELVQTRRDAARDRAEQAQAYKRITEQRVAEHQAHDQHMSSVIAEREKTVGELEEALAAAHARAADALRARSEEARHGRLISGKLEVAEGRAAEAMIRVAELEAELDAVRAELDATRARWEQQKLSA
ncbi:hypothetical protein [Nocardioides insulae]|uniref:hypothetical protein n=1 Tax=Nocardioides insulae TaxID=394734 RepID=UPI00048B01A7|nr:hypothetical protein [Nocardioides insulae]